MRDQVFLRLTLQSTLTPNCETKEQNRTTVILTVNIHNCVVARNMFVINCSPQLHCGAKKLHDVSVTYIQVGGDVQCLEMLQPLYKTLCVL